MVKKCFFCDIQKQGDDKKILESDNFFSRYDDFPVSKGHCQIVPKDHINSFFDLDNDYIQDLFGILKEIKELIQDRFNPDGYNIGINEDEAAGQTQHHLHIHLIPRYRGDVKNPRGGVRNIFPKKADYFPAAKNMPSKKDYIN